MKVRDKTSSVVCCSRTTGDGTATKATSKCMQNNVVKCTLNFDQHSYRPGSGVKCMITLTFLEEFKYRSKFGCAYCLLKLQPWEIYGKKLNIPMKNSYADVN